jgi:hypothetical protein
VINGSIPPGVTVPLHSHPNDESFYLLSGSVQKLVEEHGKLTWRQANTGDFIHVPGNVKHAWRNTALRPCVGLIVTTVRLGRFSRRSAGRSRPAHRPHRPLAMAGRNLPKPPQSTAAGSALRPKTPSWEFRLLRNAEQRQTPA